MDTSDLAKRMKELENINKKYLIKKVPVIIRLDGKAFHTFTKGFKKPFDLIMMESMWDAAKFLCESIQGCKVAYVQSDEISFLLTDYETDRTDAWFDYNVQKMVSIAASMCAVKFNQSFSSNILDFQNTGIDDKYENFIDEDTKKQSEIYKNKINTAFFDARAFNLPKEEVNNYFYWRESDATRNSIQMVAQANFSHKELQNLNCNQLKEKLFQEKNIDWDKLPICQKRGVCIIKESYHIDTPDGQTLRTRWIIDNEIPIFSQDKNYVEKFI